VRLKTDLFEYGHSVYIQPNVLHGATLVQKRYFDWCVQRN